VERAGLDRTEKHSSPLGTSVIVLCGGIEQPNVLKAHLRFRPIKRKNRKFRIIFCAEDLPLSLIGPLKAFCERGPE
jgi:hypothetical protein